MAIAPELAFASLSTLGSKLRQGDFTSVELTEFFLGRLARLGPKLNAVVTITRELALEQAAAADRELKAGKDRGPLHGIPYGAKDLLATRGIPTSWGAAPLKDQVFDDDATVIVRLREAGAVLAAKLAMVEIAGGLGYDQANAAFNGPGRNPWNPDRWSGGSSSGSGSAVGGGLVPFAIGTETWGSIMTPASYCGITGLRPTYGRVSRNGAMALSWTMDKIGSMCHTAEDCGRVLAAMAGPDTKDDSADAREFRYPPEPAFKPPFRLATLKDATQRVQPEVRDNYDAALEILSENAELSEITLPDYPYGVVAGTTIACEMAAAFEGLVTSGDVWEMTAPEDRIGAHAAMFIPAKDYLNAQRIRRQIQRALDELLAPFDAVVTPTVASVAGPIDKSFSEYHRRWHGTWIDGAANAAGLPGVSVPSGFGEAKLPTAIQFVGRAWDEARLLAIADWYQQQTEWHRRHPPE